MPIFLGLGFFRRPAFNAPMARLERAENEALSEKPLSNIGASTGQT
jgi:hypothetical protein